MAKTDLVREMVKAMLIHDTMYAIFGDPDE